MVGGWLALVVALLCSLPAAWAQAPAKPPADTKAADGKPAAKPAADQPLPIAEIPAQAEALAASLRSEDEALAADTINQRVAVALATLNKEIDARLADTRAQTREPASLATLRGLEAGWQKTRDALAELRRDVTARSQRVEARAARLSDEEARWTATLAALDATSPPQARARVEASLASIRRAQARLDREQAQSLALLNRIASEDGRANATLAALAEARKRAVSLVFARQSAPIWDPVVLARVDADLIGAGQQTFAMQLDAANVYLRNQGERITIHLLVTVLAAALILFLRRRLRRWAARTPGLAPSLPVFERPVAATLVIATLAGRPLHPEAPALLLAAFGAVALISTVVLLRRAADHRLIPVLNVIVAMFVVDQLRMLVATLPFVPRVAFLLEMAAGAAFAIYFVRRFHTPTLEDRRFARWVRIGGQLAALLLAAAAIANALGYLSAGALLARAVLGGAYSGLVLYAAVVIVDALARLLLHARPLEHARMVRLHRELLLDRAGRLARWIAIGMWIWLALDRITVRERLVATAAALLEAGVRIGELRITMGDVLAFVLTLWLAIVLSRLVRFLLAEDVFPRVQLAPGLPYAIQSTTHYAILTIGVLAALAAIGVDMTKFTILIGALTVGIGFGLQNIINNFVSGLILLFERPVKIGDVIQMGDQVGVVERIGIRASVIRTASGADVILPNGRFISDQVTNWTRSTHVRPIEIAVAVAGTADARATMGLLEQAAAGCEGVAAYPPPEALLAKFGADVLHFDVRAWTDRPEEWTRIRSEIGLAMTGALARAGISLR